MSLAESLQTMAASFQTRAKIKKLSWRGTITTTLLCVFFLLIILHFWLFCSGLILMFYFSSSLPPSAAPPPPYAAMWVTEIFNKAWAILGAPAIPSVAWNHNLMALDPRTDRAHADRADAFHESTHFSPQGEKQSSLHETYWRTQGACLLFRVSDQSL